MSDSALFLLASVPVLGALYALVVSAKQQPNTLPAAPRPDAAPAAAPRPYAPKLAPKSVDVDVSTWTKPHVQVRCLDSSYSARAHVTRQVTVSSELAVLSQASLSDLRSERLRLQHQLRTAMFGNDFAADRLAQVNMFIQLRETYGEECALQLLGLVNREGGRDGTPVALSAPDAEVIEMVPARPTSRDGGQPRDEPTPLRRLEHQPEDAVDFSARAAAFRDTAKNALDWARRNQK